jgi:hypothetical protein
LSDPTHYLDHPREGTIRVWMNLQDFFDYEDGDVESLYVDNNIAGFKLRVPDKASIDTETARFWYSGGHENQVQLGSIGLDSNPCSKLLMMQNGLIAPASRELHPMLNAMTTPRLAWIRNQLHEHSERLAATSDEHLDEWFGQVTYQYQQGGPTAAATIRAAMIPLDEPVY